MIMELCAPGGTRAVPPKEQLAAFIDKAPTLDAELVGPCLLDVLIQDGPWQVKSKVLSVVSALAESPACAEHVAFFKENQEVGGGARPQLHASSSASVESPPLNLTAASTFAALTPPVLTLRPRPRTLRRWSAANRRRWEQKRASC